jgi:hypothetical protein
MPKGVEVFRGKNKYQKLIEEKPEAIITFNFDYAHELAKLPKDEQAKLIVFGSKTALSQYLGLPKELKESFTNTLFISFWHSRLKHPDSFYGTGRSMLNVLETINIDKKLNILLIGYGQTGKGIAHYLNESNYNVSVCDIDPIQQVLALHDRFKIGSLPELARDADVVVDATGSLGTVLDLQSANYFRKPKVIIISSSSYDHGIQIPSDYVNEFGTQFEVDKSHGMINMYYGVGGSDDEAMRVTGFALLYLINHYPFSKNSLLPIDSGLYELSPELEKQIAIAFLKNPHYLEVHP